MTIMCNNTSNTTNSDNSDKNIDFKTRVLHKVNPTSANYDFITVLFNEMEKQKNN